MLLLRKVVPRNRQAHFLPHILLALPRRTTTNLAPGLSVIDVFVFLSATVLVSVIVLASWLTVGSRVLAVISPSVHGYCLSIWFYTYKCYSVISVRKSQENTPREKHSST